MREYQQAEALGARVLELSETHRIPFFTATSRCMLSHARAQLGRTIEGIELVRNGIASMINIGNVGITYYTAYLAEAQKRAGATADALETIEEALLSNPDELACRPEILRLRGELQLELRQTELAEVDFREAVALAEKMSAKAWELRASMSLARLLRDTNRRDEARTMLAEIYGWFTEGFDTPDLIDAKTLLAELTT